MKSPSCVKFGYECVRNHNSSIYFTIYNIRGPDYAFVIRHRIWSIDSRKSRLYVKSESIPYASKSEASLDQKIFPHTDLVHLDSISFQLIHWRYNLTQSTVENMHSPFTMEAGRLGVDINISSSTTNHSNLETTPAPRPSHFPPSSKDKESLITVSKASTYQTYLTLFQSSSLASTSISFLRQKVSEISQHTNNDR